MLEAVKQFWGRCYTLRPLKGDADRAEAIKQTGALENASAR